MHYSAPPGLAARAKLRSQKINLRFWQKTAARVVDFDWIRMAGETLFLPGSGNGRGLADAARLKELMAAKQMAQQEIAVRTSQCALRHAP